MKFTGLFSILFFAAFSLKGQTRINETYVQGARPGVMLDAFHRHLPDYQAHKQHGRTYFNPYPGIDEHQFFRTRKLSKAILYGRKDSLWCDHLLYDISRDRIIAFSEHSFNYVELEEEFISTFELHVQEDKRSYKFTNTLFLSDFPLSLQQGFYQVVCETAGISLLKKHEKFYTAVPHGNVYLAVFKKKELLVIRQGDRYSSLRRKKDLLLLYPGHERQIRKYLRSSKTRLKLAGDDQLRALGDYLNGLAG